METERVSLSQRERDRLESVARGTAEASDAGSRRRAAESNRPLKLFRIAW